MQHVWAVLAHVPVDLVATEHQAPLINIFEMLGALLFQTLPADALDTYLDPIVVRTDGWKGLNIALPIFHGRAQKGAPVEKSSVPRHSLDEPEMDLGYQDLSENDFTEQYFIELRAASTHWQYSDDPLIQAFLTAAIEKGVVTRKATMLNETTSKLLNGKDVVLKPSNLKSYNRSKRTTIHARNVSQFIFQKTLDEMGAKWGDTVNVKCEINPVAAHTNAYALDAREDDAAKRLGIKMTAREGRYIWLKGKGENKVFRANALVDELEGVEESVSRATEPRWFRPADLPQPLDQRPHF